MIMALVMDRQGVSAILEDRGDPDEDQFDLALSEEDRIAQRLHAAVRAEEDEIRICFSFDWGIDQFHGGIVGQISRTGPHRIPNDHEQYHTLVRVLARLNPEIFQDESNPGLQAGTTPPMNYQQALERAAQVADHVFFHDLCESGPDDAKLYIRAEVEFVKVPIG